VRAFQDGGPAIGTGELAIPPSVCAFQAIVPKTTDWREFRAAPVGAGGTGPELEPSYSVRA
jgi:phthalate 4,5-dioxygenase oxygenase subunit